MRHSYGADRLHDILLECDAVFTGRNLATFRPCMRHSYGADRLHDILLECDAVFTGRNLATFRRDVLLLSSV